MANVIKTVITYPLNGSTRDFNIPFEYLARKFIQVTLIGRDRKPLTNIDDYRFTSKNQITTNIAWGTGDGYQLIELRRFTSATERLVDFSDGSILRAYDLNVSQIQTLHVAEEARDITADTIGVNNDGNLDARGRRIVNLAGAVEDGDAVSLRDVKTWDTSAYNSYKRAEAEAQKAATSAVSASSSHTGAVQSAAEALASKDSARHAMTQAGISEDRAKASASSASSSADTATQAASNASSSHTGALNAATRAEAAADRAEDISTGMGSVIELGNSVAGISGGNVSWKGAHTFTGVTTSTISINGKNIKADTEGTIMIAESFGTIYRQFLSNELGAGQGVTLDVPLNGLTFVVYTNGNWASSQFKVVDGVTIGVPCGNNGYFTVRAQGRTLVFDGFVGIEKVIRGYYIK